MGKTKQAKEHKKFDRNVEISAPILDPELIKAIHSPPKGGRLDIRHGGFKALLSDLNSQDSTDELAPLNDDHVPSYIGISCAVSGYSNYSSYSQRKPLSSIQTTTKTSKTSQGGISSPTNRSHTSSPVTYRNEHHNVHHITIDKSNISSADEERKELTEKLTASASEHRRSPSPCIPPTEDDRHHGAYVGARYCPMPPPSKLVNKHIPLLGIDDDKDPDEVVEEEENKVEKKIANLYGEEFVEDWREAMSHKAKKEHAREEDSVEQDMKSPKDLVTLKPTPMAQKVEEPAQAKEVPTPNVKVLAGVEKQFLNRLLTDENPPRPSPPTSPVAMSRVTTTTTATSSATTTVTHKDDGISPPKTSVIKEETITIVSSDGPKAMAAASSTPPPSPASPVHAAQQQTDDGNDTIVTTSSEKFKPSASPPATTPVAEELARSSVSPVSQAEEEDAIVTKPAPSGDEKLATPVRASSPSSASSSSASPAPQSPVAQPIGDSVTVAAETPATTDDLIAMSPERVASPEGDIITFSDSPVPPAKEDDREDLVVSSENINGRATEAGDSLDSMGQQIVGEEGEHIEYEIRAHSPVDNQSSPVRVIQALNSAVVKEIDDIVDEDNNLSGEQGLVSLSPDLESTTTNETTTKLEALIETEEPLAVEPAATTAEATTTAAEATTTTDGSAVVQDGRYYLNLLEGEISFIMGQVDRAEVILAERESQLDEETIGKLRSIIGKANLLINKKCNQFRQLCEGNINKVENEQYAVLNDDLAGFWDMISIQIHEVRKLFQDLFIACE